MTRATRRLGGVVASLLLGAAAPCAVQAADGGGDGAPAAAPAPGSWSADIGVYTDYVARGLSYTSERTSYQAHGEYDWARGPYLGAALNHTTLVVGAESVEFDPYGGWLFHAGDFTLDLGVFFWWYPHRQLPGTRALYNSFEGYAGAGYKAVSLRYWFDFLDYWGLNADTAAFNYGLPPNGSSKGSGYLEINLALPLPHGFTLNAHAGHQWIRHYGQLDYSDALLGLQKELGHGLLAGVARTDTDADRSHYVDGRGIDQARAKWLFFLKWTLP